MDIGVDPFVPIFLEQNRGLTGIGRDPRQGGQKLDGGLQLRDVKVDAKDSDGATALITQHGADRFETAAIEVHLFIGPDKRDVRAEVDLVQQGRLADLAPRKGVGDMDHSLGGQIVQHHLGLRLQQKGNGIAEGMKDGEGHGNLRRACGDYTAPYNLDKRIHEGAMLTASELERLVKLRHHLHRHPELSCDEEQTAACLAKELVGLGLPVVSGIGGHGLVATVGHGGPAVGLRADMDALAITELTGRPYASQAEGVMHACGHDGHMAILIGAAIILQRQAFSGQVHLVFQHAEERYGGARMMLDAGLLDRFSMQRIFGLHNWPGLPSGAVAVHDGPVMAGTAEFALRFQAAGGHASMPHLTGDPLLAGGHFMTGIQQAVSRSVDPMEAAVVTVGSFRGGHAQNIIPQEAELTGTLRAFRSETLAHLRGRVATVAEAAARMAGCDWSLAFDVNPCSPVVNTAAERDILRQAAGQALILAPPPVMAGDDFGEFLGVLPGAYAFLGNGDLAPEAGLHQPKYDFNDAAIAPGAELLARAALLALSA